MSFTTELQSCINRHSKENGSNTPDFILAEYLAAMLASFDEIMRRRDKWYRKSNDSFQWTDDLICEFGRQLLAKYIGEEISHVNPIPDISSFYFQFRQSHTPKPQAENKLKSFPEAMAEADRLNPKPRYKVPEELKAENKPDEDEQEKVPQQYIDSIIEINKNTNGWLVESVKDDRGKVWQHEYWSSGGVYNHGFCGNSYGYFLSTKIRPNYYQIHSVKRLSDGEVFYADEITDGGNRIKSFELLGDHLRVLMESGSNPRQGWLTNIASLVKKKQSEPDWEIVSVLDTATNDTYPFNSIDDKGRFKIHSVKRLSDSEVFSVGDEFDLTGGMDRRYKIDGFIAYGNIMYATQSNYPDCEKRVSLPHLIKLQPQPQKEEQGRYQFVDSDLILKQSDTLKSATVNIGKEDLYKKDKPDWEIVEFRNPYNYPIVADETGNWYIPQIKKPQSACSYQEVLEATKEGMNKIHSVKRLSDGEVFSVGDRVVNSSATNLPHEGYAITNVTVIGERVQIAVAGGFFWLDGIEKAAKYSAPKPKKEDKREWEIVSYQENDNSKTIWTLDKVVADTWRNEFQNPKYWLENSPTLTGTRFTIHSVKRLGETIFTVGEETTVGKIKEFEILENVMYVRMMDDNVYPLRSISKLPPQPQKEEQSSALKMETPIGDFWVHRDVWNRLHAMPKFGKPQEERIEVEFEFMFPYGQHKGGAAYNLSSPIIIPEEKLTAIKQAIEQVLNTPELKKEDLDKWLTEVQEYHRIKYPHIKDDAIRSAIELLVNSGYVVEHQDKYNPVTTWFHPYFSKEEVDKICEAAFNAAREDGNGTKWSPHLAKYSKYEDYKQSKQ